MHQEGVEEMEKEKELGNKTNILIATLGRKQIAKKNKKIQLLEINF